MPLVVVAVAVVTVADVNEVDGEFAVFDTSDVDRVVVDAVMLLILMVLRL